MSRMKQLLTVAFALGAVATATAQVTWPAAGTYVWHGELVTQDAGSITVRTRVLNGVDAQLKAFKAGEKVALTWSGFDVAAHAVRAVSRYDAAAAAKTDLVLPVELVSPVAQDSTISVKVRVGTIPPAVKALKAGEWVTITSRHKPASEAQAVLSVGPYVTNPNGPAN